jgi:peptidoglycan/LPS O-acetylase OafA/YrhL
MSRHPVDLFSFVCGLLVLAAGLVLLSGNLDQVPLEWVGPVAAIALGVVIVIAAGSARKGRDESPEADPEDAGLL